MGGRKLRKIILDYFLKYIFPGVLERKEREKGKINSQILSKLELGWRNQFSPMDSSMWFHPELVGFIQN